MRVRTLCFCLALTIGQSALARDIFVNNRAGDDRYAGDLPDNSAGAVGPVRTIAKASRLAGPGDRIVLAASDEPYRETVSLVGLKHSESLLGPLVLAGNGAILDGSLPVPTDVWEHYSGDVYRFRPERLAHQQLFIKGRPAIRRPTTGWGDVVPRLEPLEWNLSGGYIYFRTEPSQVPDAYQPAYAVLQTGITLYHVQGVEIRDLVVQGFQLDGINAFDAATGIQLLGVTARGNGRSGISVGGSSRVEIRDALVGDNGVAQFRIEGYSKAYLFDCELIGNTAPAEMIAGGQLWIDGKPFTPAEK